MRFEEQFPSLKEATQNITMSENGTMEIHITDLMDNCLDKQKVKEAMKVIEIDTWEWDDNSTVLYTLNWLKKKLGLEDAEDGKTNN